MIRTREFWTYIDPAGVEYELHVPSRVGRWVISDAGYGTPPLEYITQRGPFQHGETVMDIFLRPRLIQLLIRQNYCGREEYWSGRAALLNAIRPNRQLTQTGALPGTLRRSLPDGSLRSIDCYVQDGPQFEPRQQGRWDEWSFQEVLRFIAYNPVIYDPVVHTQSYLGGDTEPVFPITFPLQFGEPAGAATILYLGTWLSYPTIIVTGPASSVVIENVTTGETITISATLTLGQYVTVTLTPGEKTVVRNDGTNLIGSVTPTSDLATWHLAPDPEAPGGVNVVKVFAASSSPATTVTVSWKTRYFGI